MAKNKNLIQFDEMPASKHRELSRKGAMASNKKQKEQKSMREMMKMLLNLPVSEKNKQNLQQLGVANVDDQNNKCLVAVGLMKRAMSGDPRAVEVLCGISGDVFTIPNNTEDVETQKKTIEDLKDFEIEFVDASKKEEQKDENN